MRVLINTLGENSGLVWDMMVNVYAKKTFIYYAIVSHKIMLNRVDAHGQTAHQEIVQLVKYVA